MIGWVVLLSVLQEHQLRRRDNSCRPDKAEPPSGRNRQKQRPCLPTGPFVLFDARQFPTLAWGDPTLPSALRRFTSEFGMGSGGTTALVPPGKFCCQKRIFYTDAALAAFVKSVTYFCMLLPFLHLPPCLSVKSFVPENPESLLKIVFSSAKTSSAL